MIFPRKFSTTWHARPDPPSPSDQVSSCWHTEQLVSSSEPSYLMSFFRQWWGINHNDRCEVTFRSWFDFRTAISFVVLEVKIPNALLVSWPPMQKRRKYILSPFLAVALRQGFFFPSLRNPKDLSVWSGIDCTLHCLKQQVCLSVMPGPYKGKELPLGQSRAGRLAIHCPELQTRPVH